MRDVVSAVFDNRAQAEQAIQQLRANGVDDDNISVIARHTDDMGDFGGVEVTDADKRDDKASGAAKGAAIGAGTGALFGLAAFFIPGVGPFVTAGALASALGYAGGAAVSGAVVGATAGGLAGMMMDYGIKKEDADYYTSRVEQGGIVVTVDTSDNEMMAANVQKVLRAAGGRSSAYMA